MSFGISPTGFNVKRQADILASLQASVRALFPGVGVEADQVMGQLLGIISDPLAEVWSLMLAVYSSQYRQGAEGISLDAVAQFVGLTRLAATPSRVWVGLQGAEGIVIPAESQVQVENQGAIFATTASKVITALEVIHAEFTAAAATAGGEAYTSTVKGVDCSIDSPGARTAEEMAVLVAAFIVDQAIAGVAATAVEDRVVIKAEDGKTGFAVSCSGNLSLDKIYTPVECEAVEAGPLVVPALTITDIATPVTGWEGVENLIDALSGRALETDTALRQRIILNPSSGGRATEASIKARLLNELPGVSQVNVISNRTMAEDGAGRPAKSLEVIIQSAGGDDDAVAQKILDNAPAGIAIVSTASSPSSGQAVDSSGNIVEIAFSRQEDVPIWLWIDLTYNPEENFPADGLSQVRAAIVALGALSVVGGDIIIQKFYKAIYSVAGIATATIYLAQDDVKPGTPAENVVLGDNQLAVYDTSRVTVETA